MILNIIYLIGGLAIGLILGTLFWVNYIHAITFGTLKHADDNGERYLFLDLDVHPEKIDKYNRVVFKVDKRDMAGPQ